MKKKKNLHFRYDIYTIYLHIPMYLFKGNLSFLILNRYTLKLQTNCDNINLLELMDNYSKLEYIYFDEI